MPLTGNQFGGRGEKVAKELLVKGGGNGTSFVYVDRRRERGEQCFTIVSITRERVNNFLHGRNGTARHLSVKRGRKRTIFTAQLATITPGGERQYYLTKGKGESVAQGAMLLYLVRKKCGDTQRVGITGVSCQERN